MPLESRSLPLAATAALALLVLTGCDPTGSPTPSPTGSATRSSTPTATATPTPTPTATSEGGSGGGGGPVALGCDTIISPATLSSLTSSGLTLTPPADFFAKIRGEIPAGYVSPWLFFEDNGGIVCSWHNGSEVIEVYGVMDLPADQYPAFRDAMVNSDPYQVEESDAVLFSSQMDGNPFRYVLVRSDGSTYLASELPLIEELKLSFP
jgi:hypothetical protein